jgi:uncharacterized protein (TIGR02145 family)
VYATVTIGSQIWTAQNYQGPGGNEADAIGTNVALTGNYYNAINFTLPAGWRLPTAQDYNNLLLNYSNLTGYGYSAANLAVTESLASKSGWEKITGTNSTGFNAYPAGNIVNFASFGSTNQLYANGNYAYFLTSTPSNIDPLVAAGDTEYLMFEMGNTGFNDEGDDTIYSCFQPLVTDEAGDLRYASVRFVKDN